MEFLVTIHSLWRWVVLVLLVLAAGISLWKWYQRASWENPDRRLPLFATIAVDIEVLTGIVLWVGQARWSGDPFFTSILHPVIMLVALGVAHMSMSRSRAQRGADRHKVVGVGLLLTLIIIVAGIPTYAWALFM